MTNVFEHIRDIKEVTGFNRAEALDVLRWMSEGKADFTEHGFRFIHHEVIDSVMVEELESDAYTLGCCSDWVIADATGWPVILIEAAQQGEQFEKLGDAISAQGYTDSLQEQIVRWDGYGPHFAHYDGEERDIGGIWYVFKVD